MRKASAGQSGTILPRYYSDPSLCKCRDKTPWTREPCDARNRDDLSNECWPNTNPERPEEETNSTRPETEDIALGSTTREKQLVQASNDPYALRSIFNKSEKKEKQAVTFEPDSPLRVNKESTPCATAKDRSNCLMASSSYTIPPLRNKCIFSSPESSIQSVTCLLYTSDAADE